MKFLLIISLLTFSTLVRSQDYIPIYEEDFNDDSYKSRWFSYLPWWQARMNIGSESQEYLTDYQNMEIVNGKLQLTVRKENIQARAHEGADANEILEDGIQNYRLFNYTSGLITSKLQFYEGAFEIKVKLPEVQGLWPAFWLYGSCEAELDIFEVNTSPDWVAPWKLSETLFNTIHAPQGNDDYCSCTQHCEEQQKIHVDMTNWNTIRYTWSTTKLQLFINDKLVSTQFRWYDWSGRGLSQWQSGAIQDPLWPNLNSTNLIFGVGVFKDNAPFNGQAPLPAFSDALIEVEHIKIYAANGSQSTLDIDYCNLDIDAEHYYLNLFNYPQIVNTLHNSVFIGNNVRAATLEPFVLTSLSNGNPTEYLFQANESIEFYPGFSMENGVDLTAQIYRCQPQKNRNEAYLPQKQTTFYPNPATNFLYHKNLPNIANIKIHDIYGRELEFELNPDYIALPASFQGVLIISYMEDKKYKSEMIIKND